MGLHGGEKVELLLHPDSSLKTWDPLDVLAISQRYDVPRCVAYGFDAQKAAAEVHNSSEAKAIVDQLNEKRPWATPRMSRVAPEWMQLLDAPACIIVHREPLSVANSMMFYSHNFSLADWISVYETYYASMMHACSGVSSSLSLTAGCGAERRQWG